MKKNFYFSVALSVLFTTVGVYLTYDSLRDTGRNADTGVLAGGLIFALGLACMAWAIRQYLMAKALRRHLRRRHS
jgi:O-antigen ligase